MYICKLMIVNFSRLDFQYITTNQIPMKRHNIIVFLFFLVFGTIEGGISAQPYIRWNAITWQSTKSLVQDWRTGNAKGYMEDPTGDGYFFLKGNGILVTRAAFPSGITVNDFRINNDSVFFCGGYQLDCDIVTETLTIRNYSFTANPFLRSTTTKATSLEYEELLVRCEE